MTDDRRTISQAQLAAAENPTPQPRPWVVLTRKSEGWIKDANHEWVGFTYRPANARLIVEAVNLLASDRWVRPVAALPAQPDPALDVERLARALAKIVGPAAADAAAIAAAYDADKGAG